MQGNSSGSGNNNNIPTSYTPYHPKGIKKLSPSSPSSSSSSSTIKSNNNNIDNTSTSIRSLGLIRPNPIRNSTEPVIINSLLTNRPNFNSNWSTSNTISNNNNNNNNNLSSSSTSTLFSPSKSTPPPPSNLFPYTTVSPGQSPFPPSSPKRNGSPAQHKQQSQQNQQQQQQQSTSSLTNSRTASPVSRSNGNIEGERRRANYHPSFQPQGVKRDRTDEFLSKRKAKGEGKKLEEGRLGRRMEKLVVLHFPIPESSTTSPLSTVRSSPLSAISDISGSLRGKSALDLWRSVTNSTKETEKAEQAIVKWQEDSEITRCSICMVAFGIKTRRHHCRLCGRVVCFLPPTLPAALPTPSESTSTSTPIPMPTRRERCSTFITHEYEKMVINGEKRLVGVTVEVEQVERDLSLENLGNNMPGGVGAGVKGKDERKKVRVCRECLSVVLRQQAQTLPVRTPTWLKLYEVLVQLEKDIEDALPEFQELVLGIQKPSTPLSSTSHPPSAQHAQTLRKHLLTDLSTYDSISKQIRDLPLIDNGIIGGSQDRLQRAIAFRATIFLTEKLGVLRSLGGIESATGSSGKGTEGKRKGKEISTTTTLKALVGGTDAEKEMEEKLGVLLEQEALVLGFVEDANHRRQFEDAQSLKASLDELRIEIKRIRAGES